MEHPSPTGFTFSINSFEIPIRELVQGQDPALFLLYPRIVVCLSLIPRARHINPQNSKFSEQMKADRSPRSQTQVFLPIFLIVNIAINICKKDPTVRRFAHYSLCFLVAWFGIGILWIIVWFSGW